jgi:hypothetical protein
MKTYLVCQLNNDGSLTVTNAIVWGEDQFVAPPEGSVLMVRSGQEWIGWTWKAGAWTAPQQEEEA